MTIEREGEEVNGTNLVADLMNPDTEAITIVSKESPSIGFLDTCYREYGFSTDYSRQTIGGSYETKLVREKN